MEKKIIAFYDLLFYVIVCGPLMICAFLFSISGKLNDLEWICKYWYLVLLFAIAITIPCVCIIMLRYCEINTNTNSIFFSYYLYFKNWKKTLNNIDLLWNQSMFITEIKNIEIVKLTKEEKQTKVYYKHWFNKYLKINMKYGNPKYVYIGNYSNYQINKIIKIASGK